MAKYIDGSSEITFKHMQKLCIKNVKFEDTDEKIRAACEGFGILIDFYRIPGKPLAFALYSTESAAQSAKKHLESIGYKVGYADVKLHQPYDAGSMTNSITTSNEKNVENKKEDDIGLMGHRIGIGNKCSYCGKLASQACGRCGDHYCTEICQTLDWPLHKRVCYTMPKLIQMPRSSLDYNDEVNFFASKLSAIWTKNE